MRLHSSVRSEYGIFCIFTSYSHAILVWQQLSWKTPVGVWSQICRFLVMNGDFRETAWAASGTWRWHSHEVTSAIIFRLSFLTLEAIGISLVPRSSHEWEGLDNLKLYQSLSHAQLSYCHNQISYQILPNNVTQFVTPLIKCLNFDLKREHILHPHSSKTQKPKFSGFWIYIML